MRLQTTQYVEYVKALAERCTKERKTCVYELSLSDEEIVEGVHLLADEILDRLSADDLRRIVSNRPRAGAVAEPNLLMMQRAGARLLGNLEAHILVLTLADVDEILAQERAQAREAAGDLRSNEQIAADDAGVSLTGGL